MSITWRVLFYRRATVDLGTICTWWLGDIRSDGVFARRSRTGRYAVDGGVVRASMHVADVRWRRILTMESDWVVMRLEQCWWHTAPRSPPWWLIGMTPSVSRERRSRFFRSNWTNEIYIHASHTVRVGSLLWQPYGIGQAVIFLPCGFFLLSFFFSFFLFLA